MREDSGASPRTTQLGPPFMLPMAFMTITMLTALMTLTALMFLGCSVHQAPQPAFQLNNTRIQARIIGGTEVPPDDSIAHTTVGIYNLLYGSVCTGSLLSEEFIVTAAHCLPPTPQDVVLIFDRDLDAETAVFRSAIDFAIQPAWEKREFEAVDIGDIALISFSGGLPEGYAAAPLLEDPSLLRDGMTVILAGYGYSDGQTLAGGGKLRKVDIRIKQTKFGKTEALIDQTEGKAACHGDSGGPAYVAKDGQLLLWGITSRGMADEPTLFMKDCSEKVVVSTHLAPYLEWIHSAMDRLKRSTATSEP